MNIILVYVRHIDQNNANKVTDHLFRRRLISSVESRNSTVSYLRQGEIKTRENTTTLYISEITNWDALLRAILFVHPEDNPCIIKLQGETNRAYRRSIRDSVI